jgi:hypothetical protein
MPGVRMTKGGRSLIQVLQDADTRPSVQLQLGAERGSRDYRFGRRLIQPIPKEASG